MDGLEAKKTEIYSTLYDQLPQMDSEQIKLYMEAAQSLLGYFQGKFSQHNSTDSPDYDEELVAQALIDHIDTIHKERFNDSLLYPDFPVTMSVSADTAKGFQKRVGPFSKIERLARSKFNYSPSTFRDDYRDTAHFTAGNDCLVLDIDTGWSIPEAIEFLEQNNLRAMIATTKSHQLGKNGIACDRFRIFLPLANPFHGTAQEFSDMNSRLFQWFQGKPDPATKDAARFYYGNPNAKIYYSRGKRKLDIAPFLRKPAPTRQYQHRPVDADAITQYFTSNHTDGQRNQTLYKAFRFAIDDGKSPEQAYQYVRAINMAASSPLPEKEVQSICRIKG